MRTRRLLVGFALAAVMVVGLGSGTAFASGSPPRQGGSPPGCSYSYFRIPPNGGPAYVYEVTASNGVNVRYNHYLSSCIIVTAGYTSDLVAVPGVSDYNDGTYDWIEVAYYQGNCQTCSNYDWAHIGWVASNFLTQAANGFTCVQRSGCDLFFGNIPATSSSYWQPGGPYPSNPEESCSPNGTPDPSGLGTCYAVPNGFTYSCQNGSPCPYDIWADLSNPNWFEYPDFPSVQGYGFFWNFDWWAH